MVIIIEKVGTFFHSAHWAKNFNKNRILIIENDFINKIKYESKYIPRKNLFEKDSRSN